VPHLEEQELSWTSLDQRAVDTIRVLAADAVAGRQPLSACDESSPSANHTELNQLWFAPWIVVSRRGNGSSPLMYWLRSKSRAPCWFETSPSQGAAPALVGTADGGFPSVVSVMNSRSAG